MSKMDRKSSPLFSITTFAALGLCLLPACAKKKPAPAQLTVSPAATTPAAATAEETPSSEAKIENQADKTATPNPTATPAILSFEDFVRSEALTLPTARSLPLAAPKSTETPATTDINEAVSQLALVQSEACDIRCARLRKEFRYVVYVGSKVYAYWDQKSAETQTNFGELAQNLEQAITSQTSTTQYFQILSRWAAAFHDGHVNAIYKNDQSEYEVYTAPLRLEVLAPATPREKVIVSAVISSGGFKSADIDLKVGDEVTKINGVPITKALDEAEKLVSGSTARMRRGSATRRLVDVVGIERATQPLALTVVRPSTQGIHNVSLYRTAELSAPPQSKPSAEEETGAEYIHAMILPGGIGYLRIDEFAGSQDDFLLNQAMNLLSGTQGLLIDVRRNGGGDQSGNVVLSRLATAKLTRYKTSTRLSDFTLALRHSNFVLAPVAGTDFSAWQDSLVEPVAPNSRYIDRPVVVLTGSDCFSACDTFVSAIKSNRLGTIVGEATGGGSGTPLVFSLPVSQLGFRYSSVRALTANGDPLEGVGTAPDQLIERTQSERASSKDQQLVTAVGVLAHQIHDRTAPLPPAVAPRSELARMLDESLRMISPIWSQDTQISPSRASNLKLRQLVEIDEVEKQ